MKELIKVVAKKLFIYSIIFSSNPWALFKRCILNIFNNDDISNSKSNSRAYELLSASSSINAIKSDFTCMYFSWQTISAISCNSWYSFVKTFLLLSSNANGLNITSHDFTKFCSFTPSDTIIVPACPSACRFKFIKKSTYASVFSIVITVILFSWSSISRFPTLQTTLILI